MRSPDLSDMVELTAKDLHRILDVVYAMNEDGPGGGVSTEVLAGLAALVGCDSIAYTHVEPRETDLGDSRMLRRLPLYVDFYQPRGTADQLLCVVRLSTWEGTALVLNRSRPGFSRRDRAIIDLITPHLAQAVRRGERLTSRAAASTSSTATRQDERVDRVLARLPMLTPRERQVVEHLVGGATNQHIARAMAISVRTVHKHLQQIYRKTGLSNRTSLMALVYRANHG